MGAVACWKGGLPIVVSGSSDGSIKAWNTVTGALIATGEGHQRDAWALGVTSEPGAHIVSGSFDRTVKVWDLDPVLRDLNWQRRRGFCMFLAMLAFLEPSKQIGLVEDGAGSSTVTPAGSAQLGSEAQATERVLCSAPLYRTIASYL